MKKLITHVFLCVALLFTSFVSTHTNKYDICTDIRTILNNDWHFCMLRKKKQDRICRDIILYMAMNFSLPELEEKFLSIVKSRLRVHLLVNRFFPIKFIIARTKETRLSIKYCVKMIISEDEKYSNYRGNDTFLDSVTDFLVEDIACGRSIDTPQKIERVIEKAIAKSK